MSWKALKNKQKKQQQNEDVWLQWNGEAAWLYFAFSL